MSSNSPYYWNPITKKMESRKNCPDGVKQHGYHPGDSWATPNFVGSDLVDYVSSRGVLDLTDWLFLDGYDTSLDTAVLIDKRTGNMTIKEHIVNAIKKSDIISLSANIAEKLLDENPEMFNGKELDIEE